MYLAMGLVVVPALLLVFHAISRSPRSGPTSQPPSQVLADEAERWLLGQGRRRGPGPGTG